VSRRRLIVFVVGGALGVLVSGAVIVHQRVSSQVDRALSAASAPRSGPVIEEITPVVFQQSATLWTDATRVNDCALQGGGLFAATEGGLVHLSEGGPPRSLWTSRNKPGLADHALTALAARGDLLVAGSRSGTLSVFDRHTTRSFRIDDGRFGAVTDLLWHDDSLFVATTSGVVLELDGELRRVISATPAIEGGVTALSSNGARLAVSAADGAAYLVDAGELQRFAAPAQGAAPSRLTALAWVGEQLFAGSPTELYRVDEDGSLQVVRRDLFVTALASLGNVLALGTFDDGVLLLDAARPGASPRRHVLEGRRIDRLRVVDGRLVALGPGLVARVEVSTDELRTLELPDGLSSNHVTALGYDDRRRLWVGHFDAGVDIIEGGAVMRRLPTSSGAGQRGTDVNALAFDARRNVMLVATNHGLIEAGEDSNRRLSTDDGLIGDTVTALLLRGEERVFATSRGLTIDAGGMRSIYAFHGLPSNRLYALAGRAEGALYVGTLAGVAVVEGLRARETLRASPDGLRANWCAALASAEEGVYIGTVGGGVSLWSDEGAVRHLPLPDGEQRYTVNPGAMLLDGDRLFVGTLGNGLLIFERDRSEWADFEQPMAGAAVTAIAIEAGSRVLDLGTDRGLLRLDGDMLGATE
jgi:ligand-binding sensor domain-containing protein